ncbi:MAG TPA: fumarylacetoacetate hydrolase family protein [Solirubrobacteraceae bacterium]|nr:fumarylacetoacetate hydrolase family protein [Solirubrobacteraceae bacterium]
MRLATYLSDGIERPAVVVDDEIVDLSSAGQLPPTVSGILALGATGLTAAQSAIDSGDGRRPLADVTLGPPVRPLKFYGIGLNYMDHAQEANREPTEFPTVFAKMANSINAPFGDVEMPFVSEQLDYEAELAIVIGKRCRNISIEDAPSVVGGYTVTNDFTIRDWQRRTQQWTLGKSFDTHGPLGPWIVTADELADPHNIAFRLTVNGEIRQQSNTSNLIHNCWKLIAEISTACTLEPGDAIATGTCSGVGAFHKPPAWLKVGDVVRTDFDGIGAIENRVVAQPDSVVAKAERAGAPA